MYIISLAFLFIVSSCSSPSVEDYKKEIQTLSTLSAEKSLIKTKKLATNLSASFQKALIWAKNQDDSDIYFYAYTILCEQKGPKCSTLIEQALAKKEFSRAKKTYLANIFYTEAPESRMYLVKLALGDSIDIDALDALVNQKDKDNRDVFLKLQKRISVLKEDFGIADESEQLEPLSGLNSKVSSFYDKVYDLVQAGLINL